MKRHGYFWMLFLAASSGLFGQAPDKEKILRTQQELAAENELAKETHFYFVLDVREKNLELKVRGMALRSWKLQSMRFWGKPAFSKTVQLVHKSTLKPPQRNVIKPGETTPTPKDPSKFELEALELKDMPKTFTLEFDNGLRVSVKTAGKGVGALRDEMTWYGWLPVQSYFRARNGKSTSELELRFEKETDAQAIYWIFFEGIKGLVY
ncbi:MAG: hypothetical protein ABSG19_10580 [Candidatus Aminicenantales bacterium]